jgi:hypothetical protein
MAEAEGQIRKAHKQSSGTDRLVNAARLSVLEKNLGVAIKRHRSPDQISSENATQSDQDKTKDETIFLGRES